MKVADFTTRSSTVADLCARWTDAEKKRWVKRMRRHLKRGRIDTVLEAIRSLRRGRNGRRIGVELRYSTTAGTSCATTRSGDAGSRSGAAPWRARSAASSTCA